MFNHTDGNPVLELDEEQSWKLLDATKHGRLVVSVAGEPDIFPVNYLTSDRKVYLRTAPGNKLAQLTINSGSSSKRTASCPTKRGPWSSVERPGS